MYRKEELMSCVVGLVTSGGEVWIGGDSAATNSSAQQVIRADAKVFVRGEYLFGCTSSYRMIQLLRYVLPLPAYDETVDLHEYFATAFIKAVRDCLKDGGYAREKAGREEGGIFLVGFRGRLFRIERDYQIEETLHGYNAAGSADDIALGALYATQHTDSGQEQRIRLALEAAAYHNSDVRPPFVIEKVGGVCLALDTPAARPNRIGEGTWPDAREEDH
jgi:hypothetical protein